MNIYTFIFLMIVFGVIVLAINAFFERDQLPARPPDLPGVFTQEEIAALAAFKEHVEAERRTYGAEYDSTC